MPKRTQSYDSWRQSKLADPDTAAAYLSAAMTDSTEMFRKALRNVAQARQMTKVARDAGVTRESLYRATSDIGNPTLDTLRPVLEAVGITMKFEAIEVAIASTAPYSGAMVINDHVNRHRGTKTSPPVPTQQGVNYAAYTSNIGARPLPNSGINNPLDLDCSMYQQSSLVTSRILSGNPAMEPGKPSRNYGPSLNAKYEATLSLVASMQQREQGHYAIKASD